VFWNSTVKWECQSAIWYEGIAGAIEGVSNRYPERAASQSPCFALPLQSGPDPQQYFDLVHGYNIRDLTFQSDAFKAFTGIMDALSPFYRSGFLFGIPELFFDLGLLWIGKIDAVWRPGFPSWSWLGWQTSITTELSMLPSLLNVSEWNNVRSIPVIKWYKTRRSTGKMEEIDNSYSKYLDNGEPLPTGWSRTASEVNGKLVETFNHSLFPGQSFLYIFPIPNPTIKHSEDIWEPQIASRTTRCSLLFGSWYYRQVRKRKELGFETVRTFARLLDTDGNWAGVLHWSVNKTENPPSQGNCELIALSRGEIKASEEPYPLFELECHPELRSLKVYEFYNVMWIK